MKWRRSFSPPASYLEDVHTFWPGAAYKNVNKSEPVIWIGEIKQDQTEEVERKNAHREQQQKHLSYSC